MWHRGFLVCQKNHFLTHFDTTLPSRVNIDTKVIRVPVLFFFFCFSILTLITLSNFVYKREDVYWHFNNSVHI